MEAEESPVWALYERYDAAMRWMTAVGLASSVVLGACASLAGEPLGAGQQTTAMDTAFTLKPAESAVVGAERVQVRFDRVVADSRCPRDARCVTAGEATVRVTVTRSGSAASTIELKTTPAGERATVGAYVLTLKDLVPVPLAAEPVRAADYRATLVLAPGR